MLYMLTSFHKVKDAFDIRMIAASHLASTAGDQFGIYDAGPVPNPDSKDKTNRAACLEFRCAGLVKDGGRELYDLPTALIVRLVTESNLTCTIR